MRTLRLPIAVLCSLCLTLLSACSTSRPSVRPDPTRTQTIEVPTLQLVPVPSELTVPTPVPARPVRRIATSQDGLPTDGHLP